VNILATSREPLRAEGERVHRLSSLPSAPASARLSAAEALGFPAIQLFVERAAASVGEFELATPMPLSPPKSADGWTGSRSRSSSLRPASTPLGSGASQPAWMIACGS
jgi:hypothetical protein